MCSPAPSTPDAHRLLDPRTPAAAYIAQPLLSSACGMAGGAELRRALGRAARRRGRRRRARARAASRSVCGGGEQAASRSVGPA
jgi:hypothetical protein